MLDYFTALEITGTQHTQDLYKMYCYLLQERPRIIPAIESEGYKAGTFVMPKRNEDKDSLTQGEVQFLVKVLSSVINKTQDDLHCLKLNCERLYEICDPEEPLSRQVFDWYNDRKTDLRKQKRKYNRLSAIQRKLKKMR